VIDIVSVDAETGRIATREPATMATTTKPPQIAFFMNDSFNFSSLLTGFMNIRFPLYVTLVILGIKGNL
jgi:hypothetical protein